MLRAKWATAHNRRHKKIAPILFQEVVTSHPDKTAFIFDGQSWSYQQVEDYSNRVANFFKAAGYKKGDVVAVFAENSPEYVAVWLGLAKIGVISSLINSNLRQESLIHCITVVAVKSLVFSLDLSGEFMRHTTKTCQTYNFLITHSYIKRVWSQKTPGF